MTVPSRDKPGFVWLEIGAPTVTKEHAVALLASRFGYTLDDIVYYGDAASDLNVMLLAGEAIAVANASPPPTESQVRRVLAPSVNRPFYSRERAAQLL